MESKTVTCQLCGLLSPNLRSYVGHVRQVHSKDPNFSLTCEIRGCSQQFSTFGAFNSHVYRAHRDSLGLSTSSDDNDTPDPEHSSEEPATSTLQSEFPVLKTLNSLKICSMIFGIFWVLTNSRSKEKQLSFY